MRHEIASNVRAWCVPSFITTSYDPFAAAMYNVSTECAQLVRDFIDNGQSSRPEVVWMDMGVNHFDGTRLATATGGN